MRKAITMLATAGLVACGGGGDAVTNTGNDSALIGKWQTKDGRNTYTGNECGYTSAGALEQRYTLTFDGKNMIEKIERCLIINVPGVPVTLPGAFFETSRNMASYATGRVYSDDGASELDVTVGGVTLYTGYKITGTTMQLADDNSTTLTGRSPQSRLYGFGINGQLVYQKL